MKQGGSYSLSHTIICTRAQDSPLEDAQHPLDRHPAYGAALLLVSTRQARHMMPTRDEGAGALLSTAHDALPLLLLLSHRGLSRSGLDAAKGCDRLAAQLLEARAGEGDRPSQLRR